MTSQENEESLYARLAPEVYNWLNLINRLYSEFFFREMTNILNLLGMERWPMTEAGETNHSPLLFSMVIFSPLTRDIPEQVPSRSEITRTHTLALEMFHISFECNEDHNSIEAVMHSFPTVGIYMCVIGDKKKQGKKKRPKARIIFEYQSSSCVCALNFFRDSALHTQVLWLATTLEAPPVASIHSIWQKHWFATYLLCILIKQHTGIGIGTLDHSTLSLLQASSQKKHSQLLCVTWLPFS
jgi:hypothetical protein